MAKIFYTAPEAAELLGCSEEELEGMVRHGELRQFRDAGSINYKVEEIHEIARKGLLDTEDPNDTSLGAELLDEIYSGDDPDDDSGVLSLVGPNPNDDTSLGGGLLPDNYGDDEVKLGEMDVQEIFQATQNHMRLARMYADGAFRWMFIAFCCSVITIISVILSLVM